MSEPTVFQLSAFQRQQFAALVVQEQAIAMARSQMATMVIAATHDPATFKGHAISVEVDSIVCTPKG